MKQRQLAKLSVVHNQRLHKTQIEVSTLSKQGETKGYLANYGAKAQHKTIATMAY